MNKELLDGEVEDRELATNLRELHVINDWLGGYAVSINAFEQVRKQTSDKPHVVVDIGSGGGGTLGRLCAWTEKRGLPWKLYGVDIRHECVRFAAGKNGSQIRFVCDDYRNAFEHVPDATILHASLFCHHLENAEVIDLIRFALNKGVILVINDLERHPLAYYSIRFLTRAFSSSRLVKNDAPLSVLRGFSRREWENLIKSSGAQRFSIRNCWAFRHQVIIYPS